ncbi:MAG: hypothetical protein CMM25_02975 [Rhodospirillaceae bacterium]|nr:hypothetical protein [Rhodospirillaceae bacterium]
MNKDTQTDISPPPPPPHEAEKIEQIISDFFTRVTMEYESLCTDIIPYLPDKRFDLKKLLNTPTTKKRITEKTYDTTPPTARHHHVPQCDIDFQIWCAQRDLAEINLILDNSPYNELKKRYGNGSMIEDKRLREEPFINMLEAIGTEKRPDDTTLNLKTVSMLD